MPQSMVRRGVLALLLFTASANAAHWHNLLTDDFSEPGAWTYQGVTNSIGQPLFQHDPINQIVQAEWDQSNHFDDSSDPYIIVPSSFSHPLPNILTDRNTFRFGATLNLEEGSIPDTDALYQIANFGLYNMAEMGPDRTSSDWDSGNIHKVKDGSDFVEFNYFIGNAWSGPNICAAIGVHEPDPEANNFPLWWQNEPDWPAHFMGENHWLPTASNLFIEVTYFGAATGGVARRAYAGVYTDPERTDLLLVNGNTMEWWTPPVPETDTFTLTHAAFWNYLGSTAWQTGPVGAGRGTFDDLYVDRFVAEAEFFSKQMNADHLSLSVGAASGTVYYLESCSDLSKGDWITNAQIQASGAFVTFTNQPNGSMRFFRVSK